MPRVRYHAGRLLVAMVLVAAPSVAMAAGASGSFTITVTIPPIAAGIQAVNAGAVGLSTLDQPGGGLLVSTPDQVRPGSSSKFDVFSLNGTAVTARVADGGPSGAPSNLATVKPVGTTQLNGMVHTSFTVVPAGALEGQDRAAPVISLVVSSL